MEPTTENIKKKVWYRACNHILRFVITTVMWNRAAPKVLQHLHNMKLIYWGVKGVIGYKK